MMYEYAVDMVCEKCSEAVHKALDGTADVTSVTTNVQAQLVVVEGSFAPAVIVEKLEKVGRKVRLIGSGCATAVEKGVFVVPAAVGRSGENSAGALSAPAPAAQLAHRFCCNALIRGCCGNTISAFPVAVAEFKGAPSGHGATVGTVRFVGLAAGPAGSAEDGPWVHVDVTIDGLAAGAAYCVEMHEFGNLRCVRELCLERSLCGPSSKPELLPVHQLLCDTFVSNSAWLYIMDLCAMHATPTHMRVSDCPCVVVLWFCCSEGADSTGKLWGFGLLGGSSHCATTEGRLTILTVLSGNHVWELIGRAIVIRIDLPADAPVPADAMACAPVGAPRAVEGSRGGAIAAVIARSAGVGANHKMLCA
jgi:copper chaperone CopZ